MESVLFCTVFFLSNSLVNSAAVTNSFTSIGTSAEIAEPAEPIAALSVAGKGVSLDDDEPNDLTTTTEDAEVNRDLITWTRSLRASNQTETDGNKNTSNHVIVVMPGLPGLPGLPGNPGQATLNTRKLSVFQDYKNCRFNMSGNGLFLCNYTDNGRNEDLVMEGAKQIPDYRNWYYTNGRNYGRTGSEHHFHHHHNRTKNKSYNDDLTLVRLDNTTSIHDKNDHSEDIVQTPVFIYYDTIPSIKNESVTKDVENANDTQLNQEPVQPIEVSNDATFRLPQGPESRQLHFEAVEMELEDDTYSFPGLPFIKIPPFHQIFAPGEPNIVIGQPGIPGKPGMPGTPGEAVTSTIANDIDTNLEVRPALRATPITSAAVPLVPRPVVPGAVSPLVPTGVLPQTGGLPLTRYPYSPYRVPGVQSSSSLLGGPGSLVSSQAMTGIGPYSGLGIGAGGYPGLGMNPYLPYSGIQQYPYSQYPYSGYPGGYPYAG